MRPPVKQDDDKPGVNQSSQHHQGDTPYELHDAAEHYGADGVHHAEADHHVADVVNTVRTGHVRLKQSNVARK